MTEPVILINTFEVPKGQQTAEEFVTAMQSPGFREAAAGLADCRSHPALYRIVPT